MDKHRCQGRWRHAGFNGARLRGPDLVPSSSIRPAIAGWQPEPRSLSRSCSGPSVTSSRRSTSPRSGPISRRSPKPRHQTSQRQRRLDQASRTSAYRQGASRSWRHVPRRRQQSAGGKTRRRLRFYGPRSDDPTTSCRRASSRVARLRHVLGMVNHVDSKSINTLDTVIERMRGKWSATTSWTSARPSAVPASIHGNRSRARSTSSKARRRWPGCPRSASTSRIGARCRCSRPLRWGISYRPRGLGPEKWKPRYGNWAFRSARLDDKFWAARRL